MVGEGREVRLVVVILGILVLMTLLGSAIFGTIAMSLAFAKGVTK